MENIISKLVELRDLAIKDLKQGKVECLDTKLELDRAIECLNFCSKYNLFPNKKETYSIIELPLPTSGYYSEYRIIDDYETEEKDCWKEVKFKGEKVILSAGDLILIKQKK